jgi:8-oxo-dGTP diphosphatase
MARGAVVILRDGEVAMIRRTVRGRVYFLFPGGTVEPGETVEQAAIREAREELGVDVALGQKLAVVSFGGAEQHYFQAEILSGTFGMGTGPEMAQSAGADGGSYTPVWVALTALLGLDARPKPLAAALAQSPLSDWHLLNFTEG